MNGLARGIATVAVSLAGLLIVLAGIGYGITVYLDANFGNGITAVVAAMLVGITLTVTIYTVAGFQNNQTHRSAGEDITEFAKNMGKAETEKWRVQREWARQDREVTVAAVKRQGALSDKEQAAAAEEAQWSWKMDDFDADAPVYYQ